VRLWFLFLSAALAAGLAGGVSAADEVVEAPADQPVVEDATSEDEDDAAVEDPVSDPSPPPPTGDISLAESAATITEALQGQDGMRIQTLCTHCNNANVQVGGLSQELVPILLNGYPVLDGLSTSMIFSVLPPDTVAGVKVTKGPGAGVAPAPAAGGVISLTESRPTELPRIDVRAEGGSFMRRRGVLRFAGPLTRGVTASIVAGTEAADPVDDDLDGFNDVGALDRQFAAARLDMEFARKHTVDIGVTYIDEESTEGKGAFDRWYGLINPGEPDRWVREDAVLDRIELRTGWEYRLGGGRTLDLRLLHGDRNQSLTSQANTEGGPFSPELLEWLRIEDVTTWGSVRFRQTLGVKGVIGVGFEVRDQQIDALFRDLAQGAADLQGPFVDLVRSYSGYVDWEQRFGTKWNLALGIRYDDTEWGADDPGYPDEFDTRREYQQRTHTSPRFTLAYNPALGWALKLIGGDSFRVPKSIFAEICCGQRLQRSVDRVDETGRTFGFEGVYQPSPSLRVSVYAARTEFEDHLIRVVARSSLFVQEYALANVSETRAEAAEFALRWRAARPVTFDGSIGWLSHHKSDEGPVLVPVTGPPTGNVDIPLYIDRIPYQPVRTGSLAATFTLPHRSSLTAQASYTGTMLIQQYDDTDPVNGLLEELRSTPSFWIAGISFLTPLTRSIELAGGIDNITDELQSDLGDPTTDFNWGPLAGRSWRLGIRYTRTARP
jgi:outer membrane receptor protein involved in Fe transport